MISRMNKVQHRKPLTAEELVERVMYRTGCRERDMLRKMADMFIKIDEFVKTELARKGYADTVNLKIGPLSICA